MSSAKDERKKFIKNEVIPFLKNHNPLNVFLDEKIYIRYCQLYNYPFYIKERVEDPRYKKILQHLGQIKSRSARAVEKGGEIKNQVLVQKIKSVKIHTQKKDAFGKQKAPANITVVQETEVKSEYKNIKKVSFSSPATKNTIEKLETQAKVFNHLTKDYCYFLQGGAEATEEIFVEKIINGKKSIQKIVRNRHQFPSLALRDKFQKKLQEMMQNPNLMTINKETLDTLKRQFEVAVKMDQAPLEFINKLTEGGFNMQKELQGAILNDKAMIENGIVEVEDIQPQVSNNAIPREIENLYLETENQNAGDGAVEIECNNNL